MFLSDMDIRLLQTNSKLLDPWNEKNLTPNGYDMTALEHYLVNPGKSILVSTAEVITLNDSLLGILHLRTTYSRQGLIGSFGVVDAGYSGQLTIGLYNSNNVPVTVPKGERFIHLCLAKLASPSANPYRGKYQGSRGATAARPDQ